MQRITTFLALCLLIVGSLSAQTRYIDQLYDVADPIRDTFANNISILTGMPAPVDLRCDVYQPANEDSDQNRPVIVLFHTGNFLPAYINQGAYGTLADSANVTMLKDLASRGYVTIHAEYRQGWLPTATDQVTRTETLLKAAYRGGQDAHAMARWLRKTVAEDDNPYQIDTSRIVFWGFGTGGYVTMTHAFLDRQEEIAANLQFYDEDGNVLVNPDLDSNPFGTTATPLNLVNHAGYSSDVAMAINTGGALGDPDWIEGADNEPITLGYHSYTDPFAPYYIGTVRVPTTGQTVVSGVAGTNRIVEKANELGLNDAIADANAVPLPEIYDPLSTAINATNNAFKASTVDLDILNPIANDMGPLSHDNMFPHVYTERLINDTLTIAGPYNWFDNATLMFILSQFPDGLVPDFETLVENEALTNPNYNNPEEAKLTLDTMVAHFIPRAFIGLNLDELVSTQDIVQADAIGLTVAPNPASDYFMVNTNDGELIRQATLFDLNGRAVANFGNVNTNTFRIDRGNIPTGQYILRIQVDKGIATKKVSLF